MIALKTTIAPLSGQDRGGDRVFRRLLPGLIIATALLFAVSIAVANHSNSRAVVVQHETRDDITRLAVGLLEQLPQLNSETWQAELAARAGGQGGLIAMALISERFDRYQVVAAYPDHLVGQAVEIGEFTSTVVDMPLDRLLALESPLTETRPSVVYVTGGPVNAGLFRAATGSYPVDTQQTGDSIRGGTAILLPGAGRSEPMVVSWSYLVRPATAVYWQAVERGWAAAARISFAVYWLLLATWVYRDARHRTTNALPWGVMALVTNILGLVVYLICRPGRLECPVCGQTIQSDFLVCPGCGTRLKDSCPECSRELEPGWRHCPACGSALNGGGNTARTE